MHICSRKHISKTKVDILNNILLCKTQCPWTGQNNMYTPRVRKQSLKCSRSTAKQKTCEYRLVWHFRHFKACGHFHLENLLNRTHTALCKMMPINSIIQIVHSDKHQDNNIEMSTTHLSSGDYSTGFNMQPKQLQCSLSPILEFSGIVLEGGHYF